MTYSHKESELANGDKIALFASRFMSTWPFIVLLSFSMYEVINIYKLLVDNHPLDIFNVLVSLYTLFVDLILLRSAISQRNMDRALSEKIDKGQQDVLRLERVAIKEIVKLHGKVDKLLLLTEGRE